MTMRALAHLPHLAQIAIVGETAPHVERSGHDLTYLAKAGLLDPPSMPKTLLADLAGAERTVSAALEALYRVKLGLEPECTYVGLFDVLETFAMPFEHRLTAPGGSLAGGFAGYGIYRTRDGWIAVAALEPRFIARLQKELGISFVHVTHSQDEAMALADLIVVMNAGRIEQSGSPRDVFNAPRTAFVAQFMGGHNVIATDRGRIAVRADRLKLYRSGETRARLSGVVRGIEYQGTHVQITLDAQGKPIGSEPLDVE